jgi:hypothetical protein
MFSETVTLKRLPTQRSAIGVIMASVDVIICFKCTNLEINLKDRPPDVGEAVPHGFGPETEALERLVKDAFATDGEDEGSKVPR